MAKVELLQGTLDMLVLRSLLFGPLHGHGIVKHIQRTSDEALLVDHGSLYPALQRLERNGWIAAKWEKGDKGRELKMYRLTPSGRKQLTAEQSKWADLSQAIARVMQAPREEA
jgi:transcriptional regulator